MPVEKEDAMTESRTLAGVEQWGTDAYRRFDAAARRYAEASDSARLAATAELLAASDECGGLRAAHDAVRHRRLWGAPLHPITEEDT